MNPMTVKTARKEAKELIALCNDVLVRHEADSFTFYGCKETASLKRKSMELTRALAELRKPS